jgi:hypothetical protein
MTEGTNSMSSDVERRARNLLLEEDGGNPDTSPYPESMYEQRLRAAVAKIKAQDRQQEQADNEREFQAHYIAANRYQLAEEIESAATQLNRLLAEYRALHQHHADTLPEGTDVDLQDFLPTWFRHRFSGFNSIVGLEIGDIGDMGNQNIPLAERDPLAEQGHGLTVKGRAG